MAIDEQGKMAYATLTENLREISEMIKRTGDRMTVVLGATVTGFGLIIRLNDNSATGWSLVFLSASILFLVLTFLSTVIGLSPKQGEQPGSTDVDEIWANFISVPAESALANSMNDVCRVIQQRRAVNMRMNFWFRVTIVCAAVALMCVAIGKAMFSVG